MDAARADGGRSGPALLTLAAELASVRAARRFVLGECVESGLSRDRCDDVVLLTSELVTNAVLHGRSEVCVEIEATGLGVRVSVIDENSRRPVIVAEDPDALDGRGLALVDALASRWGVEERRIGKAVWFELGRR